MKIGARLAAIGMPFALAACMTTPQIDEPGAAAFNPIAPPAQIFASAEAVRAHYLRDIEGRFVEEGSDAVEIDSALLSDPRIREHRILLITTSGYPDDSVSGEQWRIAIVEDANGARVLDAGTRYNCARGANPGWSRDLCP